MLWLDSLDPQDLHAMERALRIGRPCGLRLRGPWPDDLRADQLAPLFADIRADNPQVQRALRALRPAPLPYSASPPRVTAIIPTHRNTPIGLGALRAQDCELEVLVLANGPARERPLGGDRVLPLPWQGHGPTRQRGVEAAQGDYVLLTVDDALPVGLSCVREMVSALELGGYDAVIGRQLPWPTSDPITSERLSEWTHAGDRAQLLGRLDNVFALYRRDTLLAHPLPDVPIGEDLRWSRGRAIGYAPRALVLHAHPRRPLALYRRTRDLHRQHLLAGDAPRVKDMPALVAALPGLLRPTLRGGPLELGNQLAELLGQWRAAQSINAERP